MKPLVIRLNGDAAKADHKKLEKLLRRMDPTILKDQPIKFIVAGQEDGR
jgi:hypothetical protein